MLAGRNNKKCYVKGSPIVYQSGTSEQYLGRVWRDFAKRDEVVVATKFLPRTQEDIEKGITGQQRIERMLKKVLRILVKVIARVQGIIHLIPLFLAKIFAE